MDMSPSRIFKFFSRDASDSRDFRTQPVKQTDPSQNGEQSGIQSSHLETPERERINILLQQYEAAPYPEVPIDHPTQIDAATLYQHNLTTPYYLLHRQVVSSQNKVILDVGCGSGYTSLRLAIANPGAKVIGVDISSTSIAMAKARLAQANHLPVEFHVLSVEELPTLARQFDFINCDEVLYILPDPAAALRVMKGMLKPNGILRANLHSAVQRQAFYRAQQMLSLLGVLHDEAGATETNLVREVMIAMPDWVDLKEKTWTPDISGQVSDQMIRMNYLLQGDKGYTIPELFALLKSVGLRFVDMVNWQQWNLLHLFGSLEEMPTWVGLTLPQFSYEKQLQLYELIHPIHRLLDFWCTHAETQPAGPLPFHWNLPPLKPSDRVFLHPQLQTTTVRAALQDCVARNRPFALEPHLPILGARPILLDSSLAACLLPLWDAPHSVEAIAQLWQHLHPLNPSTLSPITPDDALETVSELLAMLMPDLYIMVERS
ncbi:class I SAM-dependent methyltransferase [Thermoleptolyngbya sp.]